ncbi:hypothetical protein VNO77_17082 [Canavalia gladiata]|uniref:Uncharacterized protein n=1 Tax=Canavalia gladiata TaxID=3824 RepID=A0AAN9LIF7_CANGL
MEITLPNSSSLFLFSTVRSSSYFPPLERPVRLIGCLDAAILFTIQWHCFTHKSNILLTLMILNKAQVA